MSVADAMVAAHWHPEGDAVRCELCPHRCRIADGRQGICRVRENRRGTLFALTYGRVAAVQMDPIEKKPLFHFHPGREILSVGSIGCNFRCGFCQNWHLVLGEAPLSPVEIPELVRAARKSGSLGIAYTYNEPMIWYEFVADCAREFRKAGMANVLVTNGYVSPEPLAELLPLVDAMNIDLKSMDPDFYRKICGATLVPVLDTIRAASRRIHVEVTALLVTGENDSDEAIRKVVDFVAETDPEIPLHFSRYFPQHRFTAPPTPPTRLEAAYRIGREKLSYVYVGNYVLAGSEDTRCPRCGATAVRRHGYRTTVVGLTGNRCSSCTAMLRFVV
ncbi:MAG TPA: AmmeMemoRadiSam system radical SAM enzyme [Candidatus Limnocylindrales bacterium]|nr:AmmeMemoRadiSam system radical SAM enzyme [Candidatus Limnocylindrales bacterium]